MGRPKKTETIQDPEILAPQIEEKNNPAPQIEEDATAVEQSEPQLPASVMKLMRLYPSYEEMWITPKGFVHPVGAPSISQKAPLFIKTNISTNKQWLRIPI